MDDRESVLNVFEELFEVLLVQRDAAAGTALFADEPDIVMWGSLAPEQATGRDEIAEHHRDITSWDATLSFDWSVRHVRVAGDTAWVNAAGTISVDYGDGRTRTDPYRLTAVFVRNGSGADAGWRWHTFNGSEPNG